MNAGTGAQPVFISPEQRAMAIEACRKLAATCLATNRLPEAIRYYRKSIELGADDVDCRVALGHALELAGSFDEAGQAFADAVNLSPGHVEALFRLGGIHLRQHRYREAIHVYRQALKHDPANIRVINNLANLVINIEMDYAEALGLLDRALAIEPDDRKLLWTMMLAAQNLGDLDRARQCLERILANEPDLAGAHRMLSQLTKYHPGHPHLAAMKATYSAGCGDDAARSQMGFALFKAYDDIGAHEQAFFHLEEGNRLHRATLDYDGSATRALVDTIRSTFTAEFMAQHAAAGFEEARPVFIVGLPRSGTTLTEQILACHPDVHAAGELDLVTNFTRTLYAGLKENPAMSVAGQIQPEHFRMIGQAYGERLAPLMGGKPVSTDKMPVNLIWMGFIRLALPNARFVYCRRDPVETCFSIYANFFAGTGNSYAFDLAEIGEYYMLSTGLMEHWQAVMGDVIFTLDHDALLADQEQVIRRLLGFLGLAWNDRCLDIRNADRPVLTISNTQLRDGFKVPARSRAAPYLRHLGPLLLALDWVERGKNR